MLKRTNQNEYANNYKNKNKEGYVKHTFQEDPKLGYEHPYIS